jgi:hypothetical protein
MLTEIENYVVQVVTESGQVVGAGLLVGNLHVITCAHVVNQSLRRHEASADRPSERLHLNFPFFGAAGKARGEIVGWRPIEPDGSGDVAILKLDDAPTHLSEPIFLAESEPGELWQHEFVTYGFPAEQDSGVWAHGRLLARRADGSIQVEGMTTTGYRIQRGFSGAPVFDKALNRVVGMIVAAERQADVKTAFMIPTSLLIDQVPDLQKWVTPPFPKALQDYMKKLSELYFHFEDQIGKYVTLQGAVIGSNTNIPDIVHYLRTNLTKSRNASLLILGDYGSGKSAAVFRLAHELAKEAVQNAMRSVIPFYINLSFPKGRPITVALPEFIQRYNIHLSRSELLGIMNRGTNIVFILDGFDEMANRTNWSKVPDIMQTLNELRISPGIRTVITSRTTFFRDRIEEKVIEADERISICRLGDEEIDEYLRINSGVSISAIQRLFAHYPDIRELCRLPIHVFMLSKQVSALSDIRKDDLKSVDLYEIFIERNLLVNADTFPEWPPRERRKFVQKLAYRWFKDQLFEIAPKELEELIRSEIPGLDETRLHQLSMHLLNCSFFIRIEDNYRFIHYSFVEFFVAEILVEDLYCGKLERWMARPLYAEIFDFMSQIIQRKGIDGIQIEKIVASGNEEAQSNFLATMYRNPVPGVKCYFEQLLTNSEHDLARCVACQGLGLYEAVDVEILREAFHKEQNSIIRSLLRKIAEHSAENAPTPASRDAYLGACAGEVIPSSVDAERILKTKQAPHSLHAYRKALRLGDRRWTSTIAAMYLLAGVRDKASYEDIKKVATESKLGVIKTTYSEIAQQLI